MLTPQARVIALPQGGTAVDFAYHLHSELGHRCRGARVDGAMVPLNTPLQNGQTVEIIAVKEGGPSRDWLNPQLGYLHSARARQKVRAWFNAVDAEENIAAGRAIVERRCSGKARRRSTSTSSRPSSASRRPRICTRSSRRKSSACATSSRRCHDTPPPEPEPEAPAQFEKRSSGQSVAQGASTGVLVVGVDALLTQLARCCRPAPPDPIAGFVTRGKGMSIHRSDCATFKRMADRSPERVLAHHLVRRRDGRAKVLRVSGRSGGRIGRPAGLAAGYLGSVRAGKDQRGRREEQSRRNIAYMQFTVEVSNAAQIQRACTLLGEVQGVIRASRRA